MPLAISALGTPSTNEMGKKKSSLSSMARSVKRGRSYYEVMAQVHTVVVMQTEQLQSIDISSSLSRHSIRTCLPLSHRKPDCR